MNELLDELKTFERDNKSVVDKITDGLAVSDQRHEKTERRLDNIEEKQRQKPAMFEDGASALRYELQSCRVLQDRPKNLGRGQTLNFSVSTKNVVSGVSRTIPYISGRVGPGPAYPLRLRSLLPVVSIGAGAVVFTTETVASTVNAAAPVSEGAAKPQSTLVYANTTLPVETIAHYIKVSRQTLEDLPSLIAAIESRMLYMLMQKEEDQLLNGTGTPPALKGFMGIAGTAVPAPAGSKLVDALALTAGELAGAGYMPDGAVVNPTDWVTSGLTKDSTGAYVSVPAGLIPPVVVSTSMAMGTFLVGAFATNSTLYERAEADIQIAYQSEDDFIKNLACVLVELRECLAIYQNGGFLKGVVPA
jgi:hypothetical protein